MATEKKANYDYTATQRQARREARLRELKGERLCFFISKEHVDAIQELHRLGYSANKADIVRRAIIDALRGVKEGLGLPGED